MRGIFIFVSGRGRPEAGMNEEASAGEESVTDYFYKTFFIFILEKLCLGKTPQK